MRLRNKNWTIDYINQHQDMMLNFNDNQKIALTTSFNNSNQNYALEIGCGKGNFIINQAHNDLSTNFIGMEKERTVVGVALKKAVETNYNLTNLKFINNLAENLTAMFEPESFTKIYLNFSDPWPKAKHFKKRLTYQTFLDQYSKILKPLGVIEIKTDNDSLYNFSVEQINNHQDFEIIYQTTNLYNDQDALKTNIPTEYETKFHELGKNINKIIAKKIN